MATPQGAGSRHGQSPAAIENVKKFGLPAVVSINRFSADSDAEIKLLVRYPRPGRDPHLYG